MPEPVTTSAFLATATSTWLLRKGLDWSARRLFTVLSPKDFKKLVESAWQNDAALRGACDPPPSFDHERLTPERWHLILEALLTNDDARLGDVLFSEQLINLPWHNTAQPRPAKDIGRCAARVTIDVASRAIATDDKLRGEFDIFASQVFASSFAEILAELDQLRGHAESAANRLSQHEMASAERDAEQTAMLTRLLEYAEEQRSSTARVADLARDDLELGQQLMELLDQKGRATWQEIQDELRRSNFRAACEKADDFKRWLIGPGKNASTQIRGRGYILLAHVALVSPSGPVQSTTGIEHAEGLLKEAITNYGNNLGPEERALVARFRAKIYAVRRQYDAALAEIESFDDADTVLTKLAILVDAGRFVDAYSLIDNRPIASQWADEAILVSLQTSHETNALEVLQWAVEQRNDALIDRCRLAFGRTTIARTHKGEARDGDASMSPIGLNESRKAVFQSVIDHVTPTVTRIELHGGVDNGIEADIIAIAYACNRGLGKVCRARALISLLEHRQPVHEEYARSVLRGDAPCSQAISDRLRADYSGNFDIGLLAIDIDWHCKRNLQDVLSELTKLHARTLSDTERSKIAQMAFEIATTNEPVDEQSKTVIENLCEGDKDAKQYLAIYRLIRNLKFDEANQLLSELDLNDVVTLQLKAEIAAQLGDLRTSSDLLADVGRRMPEPFFLRKAAFLSRKIGDKVTAIQLLESSLALDPDNEQALIDLAVLRVASGDYLRAADLFATLAERAVSSTESKLNQAKCLVMAGEAEEALDILDDLCSSPEPPVVAVFAKAQLLKDTDRAAEALEILKRHKTNGWDDPAFVLTYMDVAYGANSDSEASHAFQRLLEMRDDHPMARDLLQPHSIEDVIAWVEKGNRTLRHVLEELQHGRMPWLLADRLSNNPPYWAWFVRTQPLAWYSEETINSSAFTTYASNGYSVLVDEDERRRVLPIRCAPKSESVVVDLSALITLDRLGLLEKALSYFGKVVIPSSYLATVLTDGSTLLPHQPSHLEERRTIHDSVRNGRLKVLSDEQAAKAQLVDEYAEDKSTCFSASDLVDALQVTQATERAENVDAKDRRLIISEPVVVSLSTLQHLVRDGNLELALSCDEIAISKGDYQNTRDTIAYEAARRQVRDWHVRLWERLRSAPNVVFELVEDRAADSAVADEEHSEDEKSDRILAFEALALAQQIEMPLLVDDRLCQAMRLNQRVDCHFSSFGTAQVVEALFATTALTSEETTEALLQLITWRYRFIILSPIRLRAIYDQRGVAGLQSVATYLQECMRDRGLFGGLEDAELRLPMAFRLYQDWERNITGLIASLWTDTSITAEVAEQVTEWAITEFLPAIPRNLSHMEPRLATFTSSSVLMQMLFALFTLQDHDRAHTALLCVARHLGLTYEEYMRLAGEVMTGDYERP